MSQRRALMAILILPILKGPQPKRVGIIRMANNTVWAKNLHLLPSYMSKEKPVTIAKTIVSE